MNNTTFDPGPLATVGYHARENGWTLLFVRDLRHPPEKVWAALTEPEQLRKWAPFTANRVLDSTGDATLTMIGDDTTEDVDGSVIRAEPPTLLEYSWGDSVLQWDLAEAGSGTRLTLRHTMKDRNWLPKIAAGWHLCLVVAERLLDGKPIEPIRGDAARGYGWEELNDTYAMKLGIPSTGWPG